MIQHFSVKSADEGTPFGRVAALAYKELMKKFTENR